MGTAWVWVLESQKQTLLHSTPQHRLVPPCSGTVMPTPQPAPTPNPCEGLGSFHRAEAELVHSSPTSLPRGCWQHQRAYGQTACISLGSTAVMSLFTPRLVVSPESTEEDESWFQRGFTAAQSPSPLPPLRLLTEGGELERGTLRTLFSHDHPQVPGRTACMGERA